MTTPPSPPPAGPSGPPPPSRPRSERLHTIGAALVAILAVLAGILIINLLNDPSKKTHPAQPAPITATAATSPTDDSPSPSPSPSDSPSPSPSPSPTRSPSRSPSPRPSTQPPVAARPAPRGVFAPVNVYNNSEIKGLAATAADRVRAAGFDVKSVTGIRGRWPETTVYYDPPQEAAAKSLAARVSGIGRVQQRPSYVLRTGTLILIVTKDFPTGGAGK